ncbi:hypothetical protein NST84_03665 [Paenibacillus sp. FSL R7-0345]|uniref:hypothetical protein n=1 Tax=Paenibacillus sp. FSL R7-0345 TaxID=2954535 RepID=UPI00315AA686
MNRSRTLKRFLYKECDFDFHFAPLYREWSHDSLLQAIDTGRLLEDACLHLGLNTELIESRVKHYALERLLEEQRSLSYRQIELMNQYHDHTVLGHTLGELLEELTYLDPLAWLQSFENSILYLHDELAADKGTVSASSLSENEQVRVLKQLFGSSLLTFDPTDDAPLQAIEEIRQGWSEYGGKSGAAYYFFKNILKREHFLHPHPNDLLTNNRRARILKQYEMYLTVLKDIAGSQDIAQDLRTYESELHTAYTHYASAKIEARKILKRTGHKKKGNAIVKLTALITLVKDPELRILLFDALVPEPGRLPFNFGHEPAKHGLNYNDIEEEMDDYDSAREGRAALYLTIIFIAEVMLKAYVRDKLKEAAVYFGSAAFDPTQAADPGEEEELLQLKRQLLMVALMPKRSGEAAAQLLASRPYSLDTAPYHVASNDTFAAVYQWVYKVNKAHDSGKLFGEAWKEYRLFGYHKVVGTAAGLVNRLADFDGAFKQFAQIKPEDLGAVDVEKVLRSLDSFSFFDELE